MFQKDLLNFQNNWFLLIFTNFTLTGGINAFDCRSTVTTGIITVSSITYHTYSEDVLDKLVEGVDISLPCGLSSEEGWFSSKHKLYQCLKVKETLSWTLPRAVIIIEHLLSVLCFAVRSSAEFVVFLCML